jgi:hypothetical protein
MSPKQRTVLIAAAILFCLSELFPPWVYTDNMDSSHRSGGYHLLTTQPAVKSQREMNRIFSYPEDEIHPYFTASVDSLRLYAQRIAIPLLAIGLWLVFSQRRLLTKVVFASAAFCIGLFCALIVCMQSRPFW